MPRSRRVDFAESGEPTLIDYLGWLRRRWWILVVGAALGLCAAAGFTSVETRTYTSTTSVLVRPIGPEARPDQKVNLDTEAQVVRSSVVAARAQTLMQTDEPPESLMRNAHVNVPPNSQTMNISFQAPTPERAQAGSHAFTQAYLDLRVDVARQSLDTEVAALRKQIEDVTKQLQTVAGRIASTPVTSVERQRAEADRDVLTSQLTALNARLSPLLTTALDPGSIISDAPLPTRPTKPNRTLNLASGFGAGLLLGMALALLLDRLDTRVRRGRDISDRLGLPVLLEVTGKINMPTLLPASSRFARELGRLRNVLITTIPETAPGSRGRLMLVSALTPGAATGFVVGNLAAAYARTGAQVAVVTTNVDSPLARMVDGEPGRGLADVLRRDVSALQALTAVPAVPQLRVLLPGGLDPDTELPVAGLLEVLRDLSARFDHVLVETAPPTVAVEAQALANHVDAVLLVAEARRTRSREITSAMQQFEQVDAPVIGAVLVGRIGSAGAGPTLGGFPLPRRPVLDLPVSPPVRALPSTDPGSAPVVVADDGGRPVSDSTMVLPRMTDKGVLGDNVPRTGTGRKSANPTTYRGSVGKGGRITLTTPADQGEETG